MIQFRHNQRGAVINCPTRKSEKICKNGLTIQNYYGIIQSVLRDEAKQGFKKLSGNFEKGIDK